MTLAVPPSGLTLRALVPAALALSACLALAGCSGGKKEPPPPLFEKVPKDIPVLKIDGRDISGAWLRNWCATEYLRMQVASRGTPLRVDEYSLVEAGMDLIGKMVVLALEAERRGLTVSEEEIQAALTKEAQFFESTAAWRERLEKSGLTVEERKAEIRYDLLFRKLQDEIVAPGVRARVATDEMARKYYDRHTDVFNVPRRLHVLHIARSVAADATMEQKARDRRALEEALKRIEAGEKFEDVAREVSTEATAMKGGDVGWITAETPIQAEIKPAILALKKGQVTGVLESTAGYHLFKAVEVEEAGVRSFEDAREEIKKRLFDQALKLEMEKLAAQLRADLVAKKKYEMLDLKLVLGERPAPAAAPAPAVPPEGAPAPHPAAG